MKILGRQLNRGCFYAFRGAVSSPPLLARWALQVNLPNGLPRRGDRRAEIDYRPIYTLSFCLAASIGCALSPPGYIGRVLRSMREFCCAWPTVRPN